MSAINSIGLGIQQYYQPAKSSAAQAVAEGNDDSHSNKGSDRTTDEKDAFGTAFMLTLQQLGIDPDQFQQTFMAAMRSVNRSQPVALLNRPVAHLNTVG